MKKKLGSPEFLAYVGDYMYLRPPRSQPVKEVKYHETNEHDAKMKGKCF